MKQNTGKRKWLPFEAIEAQVISQRYWPVVVVAGIVGSRKN